MGAAVGSSHVVSAASSSSRSSPAPAWIPSTGCSPSGTALASTGSQALPANLLRRGLLSAQVCRSWQEPAPAWAPHGVTASSEHPPALVWGHPQAEGGDLLPHVAPWLQGEPVPPWSAPGLQGSLCSSAWSTSCPPSALTVGVCSVVPLTSSHSSLPAAAGVAQVSPLPF